MMQDYLIAELKRAEQKKYMNEYNHTELEKLKNALKK